MAYSNGYSYRKKITIDYTKVVGGANLTNFPILVKHTDTAIKTVANGGKCESGNDIRFEDTGGTQLKHEIELYVATSGELIAWVKIPTLSYTANTEIYLYYGKSGVTTEQDVANVWTSFKGVYHLNESTGTSGGVKDRTSNANHMSSVGSALTYDQTGYINKAIARSNDGTAVSRLLTDSTMNIPAGDLTYMIWAKLSSTTQASNGQIVWQDTNGYFRTYTTGGASFTTRIYKTTSTSNSISQGTLSTSVWKHIGVRISGNTSDWFKTYLDGANVATATSVDSFVGTNTKVALFSSSTATQWFYGLLSHFKIADTDLGAGWITTEYNNQSSPSTFYTLGTEESSTTTTYIPKVIFFL